MLRNTEELAYANHEETIKALESDIDFADDCLIWELDDLSSTIFNKE